MPRSPAAMRTLSRADWYKYRDRMFYCYLFYALGLGMTFGITNATEFLYIKNIIKDPNPVLYYTLGTILSNLLCVVTGIVGSVYYDFTFNLKLILCVCFSSALAGNILYSIPSSVVYTVIGNVFLGCLGVGMTCLVAYITHTYEEAQLTRAMAIFSALANLGMFLTPCLAFIYEHVDVMIGSWRITYGNIPGIIMAVYMLISLICNICFERNLSQIYNLKAERETEAEGKLLLQEDVDQNDSESEIYNNVVSENETTKQNQLQTSLFNWQSFKTYGKTFMGIALKRHFGIVLLVSVLDVFTCLVGYKVIIIRATNDFSWGVGKIVSTRIVCLVAAGLTSIAVSLLSKKVMDFYLLYASNIATALAMMSVSVLPFIKHSRHTSTILYYVSSCIVGIAQSGSHIISTTMIAKLTKSEFQGIAEAVRFSFMFLGIALSGVGVNVAVPYTTAFCIVAVLIHAIIAIILLFEYEFYAQKNGVQI